MKNILWASTAVVAAAFIVTLIACLFEVINGNEFPLVVSLFMSAVAAAVSAIVMVVWAIPMHLLLNKYNKTSFIWYVFLAVIPCIFYIFLFKPFGNDPALVLVQQAAFCSLVGVIGAFLFWYIVLKKAAMHSS